MQLPNVFQASTNAIPPMYTWPRSVKRILMFVSVLVVMVAYLLLAGGIIAFLAILADWAGGR